MSFKHVLEGCLLRLDTLDAQISEENPFPPLISNVVTIISANNQLRHMRILSVHRYEDDIVCTLERLKISKKIA